MENHNGRPGFAAPTEGRQPKKEWVLRTSSRIWRGSMAGRDWKYLSQVRRLSTEHAACPCATAVCGPIMHLTLQSAHVLHARLQGAWAPKTSKSARRNRKAAARKAGGGGGSGGKRSGGLTGAATTGSGTGGAARSEAAPGTRHDHTGDSRLLTSFFLLATALSFRLGVMMCLNYAVQCAGPHASTMTSLALPDTGEEPDVASPRKRLKHSPVSSGDGSPRYGGGAEPPLQDAGGHRERGGGRARRPKAPHDPLAVWFEHHFALLDKAREC
jgi:hypothetical protein